MLLGIIKKKKEFAGAIAPVTFLFIGSILTISSKCDNEIVVTYLRRDTFYNSLHDVKRVYTFTIISPRKDLDCLVQIRIEKIHFIDLVLEIYLDIAVRSEDDYRGFIVLLESDYIIKSSLLGRRDLD